MRIDEQLKISESQQKDKDGPTVSPAVSEDSVTSYGGAKAKLSKLVIKKFYGEAHLWQESWDSINPIQAGVFWNHIGWGHNVPPSVSPLFAVQLQLNLV